MTDEAKKAKSEAYSAALQLVISLERGHITFEEAKEQLDQWARDYGRSANDAKND